MSPADLCGRASERCRQLRVKFQKHYCPTNSGPPEVELRFCSGSYCFNIEQVGSTRALLSVPILCVSLVMANHRVNRVPGFPSSRQIGPSHPLASVAPPPSLNPRGETHSYGGGGGGWTQYRRRDIPGTLHMYTIIPQFGQLMRGTGRVSF